MMRKLILATFSLLFASVFSVPVADALFGGSATGAQPDFSVSISPASINIIAGNTSSPSTVTVTSLTGFSGNVTLSTNCASPITCVFDTNPVAVPANGMATSHLTTTVASNASSGAVTETVNGVSGPKTRSTAYTVNVQTIAPSATGGCDSLCTLVSNLGSQGNYAQLAAPGPAGPISFLSNVTANSLGYECGDPSTNSSCWVNDFDGCQIVGQSCPGGPVEGNGVGWATYMYGAYGTERPLLNLEAFSAPGIRKEDGSLAWGGGGHSIANTTFGGEGSIHYFDAKDAADSINKSAIRTCSSGIANGIGGCWSIAIPSGRVLPNAGGKPVWSQQNDAACSTFDWMTFNKLGVAATNEQTPPQHQYWGIVAIPGTTKWVIGGTNGGCGPSGGLTGNSGGKIIDTFAHTVTMLAGAGGQLQPGAYDPVDGGWWTPNSPAGGSDTNHVYEYNLNPASYTKTQFGSSCVQTGLATQSGMVIFPDPEAPNTDTDMLASDLGPGATGALFLRKHLHGVGGTTVDQCLTSFATASSLDCGSASCYGMAYDDDDGSVLMADASGHLFRIILNFASLSSSTVSNFVTTPTGSAPSCVGGGSFTNLQYLPWSRAGSGSIGIVETACDGKVYATPTVRACNFSGSTNPWSCIDPINAQTITDGFDSFSFNPGVNELLFDGSPFHAAYMAVLCNSTQHYTSIGWKAAGSSVDGLWLNRASFSDTVQTINGCNPQKYFHLTHSGVTTDYFTPDDITNIGGPAVSGDTVTIDINPSGIPYWNYGMTITASNITLNIAAGTTWNFGVSPNNCFAVATICFGSTPDPGNHDLTINAPDVYMAQLNGSSVDNIISARPHDKNITIQGTVGHPLTLYGGQLPSDGGAGGVHAIGTSCDDGLLTVNHVKIIDAGGGSGSHSFYAQWGCTGYSDSGLIPIASDYCTVADDVIVLNNSGDADAFKDDTQCGDIQGSITNSAIYCDARGLADSGQGCTSNYLYYFQCGGSHLVQNSLAQQYGLLSGDQTYFSKIALSMNVGSPGSRTNVGCPDAAPPVNSVSFDKMTNILDGASQAFNGYGGHTILACGSAWDGNDCNANHDANFVTTSASSITVGAYEDIQNLTVPTGLASGCLDPNGCRPGQLMEIRSAGDPTGTYETVAFESYNNSTGALQVTVKIPHGSGTLCSSGSPCNVATRPYAAVCITNSLIIEDTSNYSAAHNTTVGPGVYEDSGCTGSGASTNSYYEGQNGTTAAGRRNACSVLEGISNSGWNNCNTSPNVAGAWPYVPDYTKNPPSQAAQATAAAAKHCTGSGTVASPYSACDAP